MILFNSWNGFDLSNEVRGIRVTAFRQMDFVAYPIPPPFASITHFGIVRRTNPLTTGRHVVGGYDVSRLPHPTNTVAPTLDVKTRRLEYGRAKAGKSRHKWHSATDSHPVRFVGIARDVLPCSRANGILQFVPHSAQTTLAVPVAAAIQGLPLPVYSTCTARFPPPILIDPTPAPMMAVESVRCCPLAFSSPFSVSRFRSTSSKSEGFA